MWQAPWTVVWTISYSELYQVNLPRLYLGIDHCANLILGNWQQTIPPRACEFMSQRTRQTFTKIDSAPSHHQTPPTPPSNLPSSCLESDWAQTA
jgi:hypothetical protein